MAIEVEFPYSTANWNAFTINVRSTLCPRQLRAKCMKLNVVMYFDVRRRLFRNSILQIWITVLKMNQVSTLIAGMKANIFFCLTFDVVFGVFLFIVIRAKDLLLFLFVILWWACLWRPAKNEWETLRKGQSWYFWKSRRSQRKRVISLF